MEEDAAAAEEQPEHPEDAALEEQNGADAQSDEVNEPKEDYEDAPAEDLGWYCYHNS